MIFSVSYKSKYKDEAEEIRCPVNQLGRILDFIRFHPEKRYNVSFVAGTEQEERLAEQIDIVRSLGAEYTIQTTSITKLKNLRTEGYSVYLPYPVTDWETYAELRKCEVSDLYIDGPLGFSMEQIRKSKGDTKIRTIPFASPNTSLSPAAANSFFIRPEDLHTYSALDIVEFSSSNQEKEDALYTIYKRGNFDYSINELIDNLPLDINNRFIKPDFAKERLNCHQVCKVPGHSCHHCETYFNLISTAARLMSLRNSH